MEPDTKKWLIVGLVVALVLIGIAVGTMMIKNDFETPAGTVISGCEPCTEGCACDSGAAPDNQGTP